MVPHLSRIVRMKPLTSNLATQDREAVFPTRQSLGVMKAKLKGAETGHSLLKRKSEALTKFVPPDQAPKVCERAC